MVKICKNLGKEWLGKEWLLKDKVYDAIDYIDHMIGYKYNIDYIKAGCEELDRRLKKYIEFSYETGYVDFNFLRNVHEIIEEYKYDIANWNAYTEYMESKKLLLKLK